jgi:hypothetical protein
MLAYRIDTTSNSFEDFRIMTDDSAANRIDMDRAHLYREETFTDRRVGTLQKLTPVNAAGDTDTSRSVLYVGQTQVLTPGGALPLSFEIEASSLDEAVERFGEHAEQALTQTMQRLEEMRRDAASSLIVPGQPGPGSPTGGIQIP